MPVYSQKGYPVKAEEKPIVVGCGMTTSPKPISNRHIISYGIHMDSKIESCTKM